LIQRLLTAGRDSIAFCSSGTIESIIRQLAEGLVFSDFVHLNYQLKFTIMDNRKKEKKPAKGAAVTTYVFKAIGTHETGNRKESDSMGMIEVPAEHYWGAQTQRSLIHFSIGNDRMPKEVYHAYGYVKKAAALVNLADGRLPHNIAEAITAAADEVIAKKLDTEFPLYVWQTGSGTQSNMNVNEVISNRATQLLGGKLGSKTPVHPNDHVNMGQSSNDSFPTAMHIVAVFELDEHLIPALDNLHQVILSKAKEWKDVVKIGRTHLQDAVPLTVGQEWSGYATQIADSLERVKASRTELYRLAAGGTAVGTGLNAPDGFAVNIAAKLAELTGKPFITAPNKFAAQGSLDAIVAAMAALRGVAVALMKIANDMRWLASGPRCGLGELILPANEPGSSIMPGKVNPTQCEAMVMICIQVIGEDTAVAFAGSQGNFELNAMRPIIINNFLHSARILADGCDKFRIHSVEGTILNRPQIDFYVQRSLMLVTALSPVIGYDKASTIAHHALDNGQTLKEAALATGFIDEKTFDEIVDPRKMV
jgi:fumarate hydratase, class II